MKDQTNSEVGAQLRSFEEREQRYLALIKQKNLSLPMRLTDWRAWIGDSAVYLNELRNFAEQ